MNRKKDQMEERTEGRTDGRTEGQMDRLYFIGPFQPGPGVL